ncbi:MAG: 4Fe-4S dicluster domain-containing protein [Thermoproteota archaeon]|nr:MAG: 4Fe-4S dicluster domain-containing protein [Candidatus Korarchaeota archaeon]
MVRAIIPDPERCVFCFECALACSHRMEGMFSPARSRVRVLEAREGHGIPVVCVQCPDRPCVEACPTGALSADGGVVRVDPELCVGCGSCHEACPAGAVWVLEGLAVKCEVCEDPPCVRICPTGALRVEDAPDEVRRAALDGLTRLLGGRKPA